MILAGNITPIDVITHIPILCEEKDIPYIYVPAKEHLGELSSTVCWVGLEPKPHAVLSLALLGAAASTRRPTSCIMVLEKAGAGERGAAMMQLIDSVN